MGLIGRTPLVDVSELVERRDVRLVVKLEGQNLLGSLKDRPALYMIEDAEETGRLRTGMTVLEASSGNTAIAVSAIGGLKGYPVRIVAPESITPERKQLLEFYGASLVFTAGEAGTKRSYLTARSMAEQDASLCWLDQYGNPANPRAHYETTGKEIEDELPEVDVLVAGLGSGGTLMGTGRRLRERHPRIRVVAVEPDPTSKVHGLRNLEQDAFVPPILRPELLDARLVVSGLDAVAMVRRVGRELGLFIGMSAGAVLVGAVRYARRLKGGTVCAILADAGWKYLSTGAFRGDVTAIEDRLVNVLDTAW